MKSILLGLLYTIMARYIGGGLMKRMTFLVESAAQQDVPSAVKRQRVLAALTKEAQMIGTVAINAALEIALLKLRAEGKD